MKLTRFTQKLLSLGVAGLLAATGGAFADDGAIINKSMTRGKLTINLPDFGQDVVNSAVPEAEHAFTDMMGFYVPAQRSDGNLHPLGCIHGG